MTDANLQIDLSTLVNEENDETLDSLLHNVAVLKSIRAGLRMAERHRTAFAPRSEYWRVPERRIPLAYLTKRFGGRFAPPSAVRTTALRLLQHMDQRTVTGSPSPKVVHYDQPGVLAALCTALAEHARHLRDDAAWRDLQELRPDLGATPGEDAAAFFETIPQQEKWEDPLFRRLPWFGYLSSGSLEELYQRQAFFYGFANLWNN
jgi:hypothetical protein